jgi:hypothetical protein
MGCEFLMLCRLSNLLILFPCSPAGIKLSIIKCIQGLVCESPSMPKTDVNSRLAV